MTKTNSWKVIVDVEDCPEYKNDQCFHKDSISGKCIPDDCPRPNFQDEFHDCHKTTTIILNNEAVEIDCKIAELIILLNELGLKTLNSCQGASSKLCSDKHAYIEFQPDLFESLIDEDGNPRVILRWKRP